MQVKTLEQEMIEFHYRQLRHANLEVKPSVCLAQAKLIYFESQRLPYEAPSTQTLHDNLRITAVVDGGWVAICGKDGLCGGSVIPRYHAGGSSAKSAYHALDSEIRARYYSGNLHTTAREAVECLDLLFVFEGWNTTES